MPLDSPSDVPSPAPRQSGRRWAVAVLAVAAVAAGVAMLSRDDAPPWAAESWETIERDVIGRDAGVADALAERLAADSTVAAGVPLVVAADGAALPAGLPDGAPETASDARVAEQAAVRAFYAARDGAPAWTSDRARTAALALLARADHDGLPVALPPGLDALARDATADAPDSLRARLDARLTAAVLAFGARLHTPRVDAAALYGRNAWEPAPGTPRDGAAALAAALDAADTPAAALRAFAESQRPAHAGYRLLRAALSREIALAAAPDLALAADLAPADSGAAVQRLRARLAIEEIDAGDGPEYDADLGGAVRVYQTRQGLPASGQVDAATRAALNRRQPETIPALALNLERWRWLPDSLGRLHVLVNIPAFEMTVREQTAPRARYTEVFRSRVVVGQPSWATPVFSDTMETVVFNPTWMMPASIQIESYGRLRPDRALRQPGPGNALGRVKFLFPNRHAVYLHDTPSKWGFTAERRALSHGCVRVGDPPGLARTLLTRTNGWDTARVDSVITGPWTLRPVTLDRPVLVHIAYFTASADPAGRVTTYADVYRRDARLAEALGLAPAETRVAANATPTPAVAG